MGGLRTPRQQGLPREGSGATVERGNLPNSKRCSGSRSMAGDNTRTITLERLARRQLELDPSEHALLYCLVLITGMVQI